MAVAPNLPSRYALYANPDILTITLMQPLTEIRLSFRRAIAGATVAAAVLCAGGAAQGDPAPPADQKSQFETHFGASLNRDCGFSRKLPSGQTLWIFCDTAVYDWTGTLTGFVAGTTAAEGAFTVGQVPQQLVEVPTPPGALAGRSPFIGPAQFLPNPTNLTRADGSACAVTPTSYPAAWATGVAQEPNNSSKLLITYWEVCVDSGAMLVEGFGLLEYDSSNNTIASGPTEVFRASGAGAQLPAQQRLGSPIFSHNILYLFASVCDESVWGVCTSGRVFASNVLAAPAYWQAGANYFWWFSTAYPGWSQDAALAQSVIPGATPFGITVDRYDGKGVALVEETTIAGGYRIWQSPADTFVGAWTAGPSAGSLTGCDRATGVNLCRALTGHPELSTPTQLLMSYFNPADNHVAVVAVPW